MSARLSLLLALVISAALMSGIVAVRAGTLQEPKPANFACDRIWPAGAAISNRTEQLVLSEAP